MMERMTEKYHLGDGCYMKCTGNCNCEDMDCIDCPALDNLVDRLGAYEDTELTPERCAELAKADKDGRLVVLPCKVGDTVFILADNDLGKKTCVECIVEFVNIGSMVSTVVAGDVNTHWQYGATFSDVGKTVFLTREEAEAALKEADHA